jgi:hypothetical protein
MNRLWLVTIVQPLALCVALGGCGSSNTGGPKTTPFTPVQMPGDLPAAGTSDRVDVAAAAVTDDISTPTTVVGTGTPASCTSKAFVDAVWAGGIVTFNCGPDPVTINLDATAEVNNLGAKKTVIDGGGLVTLSGNGAHRIIHQDVCLQRLGWATSDCWGQDFPRLTLQNLTFTNGFASDEDGGGAVRVAGGRFKIVNCRFFHNTHGQAGPDVGGGAVRVRGIQAEPVYIVQTTFGGAGDLGNSAANGGGLSGLFANFYIYNSTFVNNSTTSCCGNPTTSGAGGGSGGAIYMDGNQLQLELHNVDLTDNSCQAHGSAIFFVSNDGKGTLTVSDSVFSNNAEGEGNWYAVPDISMDDNGSKRSITNTTVDGQPVQ